MKHPIPTWTLKDVERWRRMSSCVGRLINYTFTASERQQAIDKLQTIYPARRVYPAFAERILYLSELY